ncbi:gasdermin Eb [Pleuronectes platessa]|uniref:gasdermin Eb n=1 Tax=Pleuronectes platessa TaxID=8262 RepID=UPI00232A4528|nr:gasdermin Eb [Pleuronectes platessa]
MFATATRNFVEEVDNGGLLIPVSSLNDTIELLTVVVKRKRFWFWQKPKYLPTDFNLNDILAGDVLLQPVTIEIDFIKFNGTYGDNKQGAVDANFSHSGVSLHAKDSSKLQSSFDSLKKDEVNVQELLQGSKSRVLDMSHCLILQTKEKHRRVLGIVKERIVTTKPCSVIEEVQQGGECGGSLTSCGPKCSKVSLKENGKLSKDSNVTMEIPTHTTIAYALIELEIKQDGCYELCLMSDTKGGFEVDGQAHTRLCGASGADLHASENSRLQQDLEKLRDYFQLLSTLPASKRSSLLQQLTQVMQDQVAVRALQDVLDQMCPDKSSVPGDVMTTESQTQNVQAILDLVEQCGEAESAQTGQATSLLTALHLISSALDEMTNECRAVLGMCCSHSVLNTLELLVQCASGSGELSLSSTHLTALTEDVYEKTAHLFASSNMRLKRDGDTVWTEIIQESGNLPLVLCIAVRGLTSLTLGV